jgi:hypothetical protein
MMMVVAAIAIWSWVLLVRLPPHIPNSVSIAFGIEGSYGIIKIGVRDADDYWHPFDIPFPLTYIAIIPAVFVLCVANRLKRRRKAESSRRQLSAGPTDFDAELGPSGEAARV